MRTHRGAAVLAVVVGCIGAGACGPDDPVGDHLRALVSETEAVSDALAADGEATDELAEVEATWTAVSVDVAAARPRIHLEIEEAIADLRTATDERDPEAAEALHLQVAVQVDYFLATH